jgi:hypothetical protein
MTGEAPTALSRGLFNFFAKWASTHGQTVGPLPAAVSDVFAKALGRDKPDRFWHYNRDEQMIYGAGRSAVKAAEEQAHSTHFYRRGRTWTERSVNHPYLGLYPASYMWGKVLPEMGRFLLKKPFGMDAPLGGLMAANHVYDSVQLSAQSDGELKEFIDNNPDMLRMLNLLTPGTPWEIPVNMPAWARNLAEVREENARRQGTDATLKGYDLAGVASRSVTNAFGLGRDIEMLGELAQEFTQPQQGTPEALASRYTSVKGQVTEWHTSPNGVRIARFADGSTKQFEQDQKGQWHVLR